MPSQKTRVKSRRSSSRAKLNSSHRIIGALLLFAILSVGAVVAMFTLLHVEGTDGYVHLQTNAKVKFPEDQGPHDHTTEWWYYNGQLVSDAGEKFSYHMSFFAHRTVVNHTIMHVSLLDHQTKVTKTYETRLPGFSYQSGVDGEIVIDAQPWRLFLGRRNHSLRGEGNGFLIELDLSLAGPLVLQDDDGVIDFEKAGDSYYYSRPRMPTTGKIKIDGKQFNVVGDSWYDHQWGDFRANVLSWEWFALQLDTGADVMIFVLRDYNGREVYIGGTYTIDNKTTKIAKSDLKMAALGYWESPVTGTSYPVSWKIEIPGKDVSLMLLPIKRDSEFDARKSSYNAYWEGPVAISGSHSGKGFLEVSRANAEIATRQ